MPPTSHASSSKLKKRFNIIQSSDDENDVETSPNPAKRARNSLLVDDSGSGSDGGRVGGGGRRKNGEMEVDDDGDDRDAEDGGEGERIIRPRDRVGLRPELERADDGFITGSVVRVKMKNFMTYTAAEFRPGPYLNMIIGPNGTGKSTISSAIAIGLGWNIKVLGRGEEMRAFIKLGEEFAETEVELKGRRGKKNLIVWRKFTREHKYEWKVNNEPSNKKAVTKLIKALGVEEANLCSFLPQDKVADFAKLQPNFLLKQTIFAAGDPRLTEWYNTLCVDGKRLTEVEDQLKTAVDGREINQAAVDTIEPDLRNYQARQENEFEYEVLKLLVRAEEPKNIKNEHLAAVDVKNKLKNDLASAQARRQPLLDLQSEQRAKESKAGKRSESASKALKQISHNWKDIGKDLEKAGNKVADAQQELEQLKRKAEILARRKADVRSKLEKAKEDAGKPLKETEIALTEKKEERKELIMQQRRKREEVTDLEKKVAEDEKRNAQLSTQLNILARRQQNASNAVKIREDEARKMDPSIGYALDWLEQNEAKLEKPIARPAIITVNITDPRYAWQVEMCVNFAQKCTFVCQTKEDYAKMLKLNGTVVPSHRTADGRAVPEFKVRLHLSKQDVTQETIRPVSPCSQQELNSLGMDGFAIDFVDAPAPILAFLCEKAGLHNAAMTQLESVRVNQQALREKGVMRYITKNEFVSASQSRYGRREFQTSSRLPVPAKGFTNSVDQKAIKEIDDEIGNLKREMKEFEKPFGVARSALEKVKSEHKSVTEELVKVEAKAKALQQILTDAQRAHLVVENTKKQLAELEREPSQDAERTRLKKKILEHAKSRIALLKAYNDASEEALDVSTKAATATLVTSQCNVNIMAVDKHVRDGGAAIDDLKATLEDASGRVAELKLHFVDITTQVRQAVSEAPKKVQDAFKARHVMTELDNIDDLNDRLANVRAELEGNGQIQYDVVRKYETAVARLKQSKEDADRYEKSRNLVRNTVNDTLAKFDPCLNTLVEVVSSNFTTAFESLNCSGEVRISRVENKFEQWGIEIMVSYRDGDALALLTANHQSGGERSLATVTYLMSLCEMARTPFSLVDEINQGMDQRAEKAVHQLLVDTTCNDRSGQYFLITPKLLPNLNYHERMKILVINNGIRIPDDSDPKQSYGALKNCLNRYRRTHAITA